MVISFADIVKKDGNVSNAPVIYIKPERKTTSEEVPFFNHYTNFHGKEGIRRDGFIKAKDHGHFGEGVFFTSWYIRDGLKDKQQIAISNWGPSKRCYFCLKI